MNELWQTDFTHLKVQGWSWYHLSTFLDDYSRYILAWKHSKTIAASDVQNTLEPALAKTNLGQVKVRHHLTPEDVYVGRVEEVKCWRETIKEISVE